MREIVGAKIGNFITNNPAAIRAAVDSGFTNIQFLDRQHMALMAAFDLGQRWNNMASGPTLFRLDKDGTPHAPIAGTQDADTASTGKSD